MPMMPFMGVRISWLMLARNCDLAWLAAAAAALALAFSAAARASSKRRRNVSCVAVQMRRAFTIAMPRKTTRVRAVSRSPVCPDPSMRSATGSRAGTAKTG